MSLCFDDDKNFFFRGTWNIQSDADYIIPILKYFWPHLLHPFPGSQTAGGPERGKPGSWIFSICDVSATGCKSLISLGQTVFVTELISPTVQQVFQSQTHIVDIIEINITCATCHNYKYKF